MQKRTFCEGKENKYAAGAGPPGLSGGAGRSHRSLQLLFCAPAPRRRRSRGLVVASQPRPALREPAVDRGGLSAQLLGREALHHPLEIRRRAGPHPSGWDDRCPDGRGVSGQPLLHPWRALQLGQRDGFGAHLPARRREPSGVAALPEPPAGRAAAGQHQQRPQPPCDDRGRGRGRCVGHQRLQEQRQLRPPGGGGGR